MGGAYVHDDDTVVVVSIVGWHFGPSIYGVTRNPMDHSWSMIGNGVFIFVVSFVAVAVVEVRVVLDVCFGWWWLWVVVR